VYKNFFKAALNFIMLSLTFLMSEGNLLKIFIPEFSVAASSLHYIAWIVGWLIGKVVDRSSCGIRWRTNQPFAFRGWKLHTHTHTHTQNHVRIFPAEIRARHLLDTSQALQPDLTCLVGFDVVTFLLLLGIRPVLNHSNWEAQFCQYYNWTC
jgi:hypothetical protein